MSLPTIDLDDRSYAQLLDVLRGQIPGDAWSDHNPSDPGIALLELLTWLGEMSLYRMNRIPAAHQEKFLKLLADPPAPVTVELTLELSPASSARASDPEVPPGLRFATDYKAGRRHLFESYSAAVLKLQPGGERSGTLRLRAVREIEGEVLGISDGTPDQTFPIAEAPVLVDFSSVSPGYDPNPRLRVGAREWTLRPFLLSSRSRATSAPAPEHFMVDEFENRVRFGDGTFGAVPPAGAAVELVRYQVLEGRRALVAAGEIKHLLNPERVVGLLPGEALRIAAHGDAQGGERAAPPAERVRRGLETFRGSGRLVTASDFERVATVDFNAFQRDFNDAQGLPEGDDLVGRAVALMNCRPPLSAGGTRAGHVTLIVLPSFDEAAFEAAPLPTKIAMASVSPALRERLTAFLEPRRLITTRLHVSGVDLKAVSAQIVVVVDRQRNTRAMTESVVAALRAHLSPTRGHGGGGWPLGRAVRCSQLYALLEGLPGVDYVEGLTLSPAGPAGDVELTPQELPVWGSLNVQGKRA